MSLSAIESLPLPRTLLALALALGLPGCQPVDSDAEPATASSPDIAPRTAQPHTTQEMWDLMTIKGQPVGYQLTRIQDVVRDGQPLREVNVRSQLTLQRFGQTTRQQMEIASLETPDGRLLQFRCTLSGGQGSLQTTAVRQDDMLQLTTTAEGKSQSWSLPLPADCGGLFAVENSLLQQPLQPGESRSLQTVVPVLHLVGTVRLRAVDRESTELWGATRKLLQIESHLALPDGQTLESQLWTDAQGQILKSQIPALQQVAYRVDRETALQSSQLPTLDLTDFSLVRVSRALAQPHQTDRIRYLARLATEDPSRVFPVTPSQSVQRIDERTAQITVTAPRRGVLPTSPASRPAEEQDLLPSPLIQSDDATVRQLAQRCAEADADPRTVALAVERFVHEAVDEKNFTTAFATAAEVARSREGDCTEHAVLTAALCRARGIPARVVVGLVYVPAQQAFAFHMWDEAWIEDQWLPLDATLGPQGMGADHLTLGSSALDSSQAFSGFLPVIRVLGQLQLEIVDVQSSERGNGAPGRSAPGP